jgi:DNA-binding transcriptional LysR family regulator
VAAFRFDDGGTCTLGHRTPRGRRNHPIVGGYTRRVELTPDGRQLLAVIQRSLEELDVAIANIGRGAKRNRGSISLGTTPLVAANILPPAMREFRKLRPDLQIQLFDADLPTLIQMVEAGKLDMSLGIFKAMPDIRHEPFFRFSLGALRLSHDQPPRQRAADGSRRVHVLSQELYCHLGGARRRALNLDGNRKRHSLLRGIHGRECSLYFTARGNPEIEWWTDDKWMYLYRPIPR